MDVGLSLQKGVLTTGILAAEIFVPPVRKKPIDTHKSMDGDMGLIPEILEASWEQTDNVNLSKQVARGN